MHTLSRRRALCIALLLITATTADAYGCVRSALQDVLPDYVRATEAGPLQYQPVASGMVGAVIQRSYRMQSQAWSPGQLVTPAAWQHDVSLYIPPRTHAKRALLFINNGDNTPAKPENNLTPDKLAALALASKTIVVSLGQVPNQTLLFKDDNRQRKEDDSAAHSWQLFMRHGDMPTLPLHVPMAAAASRAMTLAQQELARWKIDRFIVVGASKRGWAAWLSAVADDRVVAIVPAAMDLVDLPAGMAHIQRTYGGSWPIAVAPYVQEGITRATGSDAFARLSGIISPASYLPSCYRNRLAIPKYIISASGDDFYVPDLAQRDMAALPGPTTHRFLPDSDHAGTLGGFDQGVIAFIRRLQTDRALPTVTHHKKDNTSQLDVHFSERPVTVTMYQAHNPVARDFRKACGIRYNKLPLPARKDYTVALEARTGQPGWTATFVEARFGDGYIATTPVYVTPADRFPESAPPDKGGACRTLPGN